MNSRWRIPTFLSILGVLALAPAAPAGVPVFPNNKIVPHKSIAGVHLGDTKSAAKKAWGADGAKCEGSTCTWSKKPMGGKAEITISEGKVIQILLGGAKNYDTGKYDIPKFLKKPKTSKGIRIGSTRAEVLEAYPAANDFDAYIALDKGTHQTAFGIDEKTKKVVYIYVN